jgi:hypothetical protein
MLSTEEAGLMIAGGRMSFEYEARTSAGFIIFGWSLWQI